jgi:hypothetical protein
VYGMFRDAGSREAAGRLSSVSAASRPLSTQQSGTAKATTSVHVTCDLSGRLAAPLSHALDVLEEIWFTCLLAGSDRWACAGRQQTARVDGVDARWL